MSTGYEKPPREPVSTVMQVLRDAGLTLTLTPDRIREQLAHLDRGDGMTLTDAEQRALCNMALAASRDDASMADKRDAERWVPVSERLPDPCQYVLCNCEEIGMASWQGVGYLKNNVVKNDWHIGDWHTNDVDIFVSHWMPLPAPPAAMSAEKGGK